MKKTVLVLGALFLVVGAAQAWAQNPPPGGGQEGKEGELKTEDMDPYASGKREDVLKKALPMIAAQASKASKTLKSYTAKFQYHHMHQAAGKDEKYGGTLKALKVRGKMTLLWEAPEAPKPVVEQIVGQKVLYLWTADKIYKKVDFKRLKKDKQWPVELFYPEQFSPSALKKDFSIELISIAGKWQQGEADDKPPVDDPFRDKAKDFEGNQDQAKGSGPNPDEHHVFVLKPKDPKLAASLSQARLHVHYKTFVITRLEVRITEDGSNTIAVNLSNVKLGADVAKEDVEPSTDGYKEEK